VGVDSFGNVFVTDDVSKVVHMINPTTGIMTLVAGNGTACTSGKVTSAGDGCIAATNTIVSGQRGMSLDPWGNVLLAGYSDNLLHVVCRTASPLCTSAQIGTMQMLGGCVATTGGSATGSSTSIIGIENVPGKVVNSSCSSGNGTLAAPRGIAADIYGNVYYADTNTSRFRVIVGPLTSSYFSGANPLYAALGVYYPSVTAGYVYTVVNAQDTLACVGVYSTSCGGSGASPASGAACSVITNSVTYSGTATDALGDGCPLKFSSVASSSGYTNGVAVDAAGNMIFADPTHGLRVMFVQGWATPGAAALAGATGTVATAGVAMYNAIFANDGGVTPQAGFIYMLAGKASGGVSLSTTPTLGTSTTVSDSTITKVTVSPQGNIYIGDSSKVLFFDIDTGYIRTLFTGTSNVTLNNACAAPSGQKSLSAYSDGCAASSSLFTNSNGLGVAVDGQGNLYLYDASSNTTGMLVRKVLAQGLGVQPAATVAALEYMASLSTPTANPAQTLGTVRTETINIHLLPTATGGGTWSAATATLSTNSDISAGTLACTAQGDHSYDCTIPIAATPSEAGLRSATVTVSALFTPTTGTPATQTATIELGGTVTGSVLAVDNASAGGSSISPTTNAILGSITPAAVAVDGEGNVYAASGTSVLESIGTSAYTLSPSLPAMPSQIAVDQAGNLFSVAGGQSTITELQVTAAGSPSSYSQTTVSYTPSSGTAAPQAVAVDSAGNLFVADYQASGSSVYRLSLLPNTLQYQTTVASGLVTPVSLAVDPSGNVYVADKGAGVVYEYSPGVTGSYALNATRGTLMSGVTPVALAVDAAGDVYVQDEKSDSVIEVPVAGSQATVLTGLQNPTGLAVDGVGNVYSADSLNTSITQVLRGAVTENFGTSESTTFAATLTNVGSQASTGQNTTTSNTTNFVVTGCNASNNVVGPVAAGTACTLNAKLTGSGTTEVFDYIGFLPSASTPAGNVLTLQGQLQGTAFPTTLTIGSATGTLTYAFSGTEASFTITVAANTASSAPVGSVNVYVDSASANTQYALTAATSTSSTATVNLSGLTAGSHTIAAVYPTTGQFTGSGSATNTTAFGIAQAGTLVSWTPGSTTQQVSQAIGAGVLNASATTSDTTATGFGGTFAYTVTPSGGSATNIDASTYLPIGTYSLAVTFTPTDSVDYATSTATVGTYTVTKAGTTATVGASTNVVAADGTGNYTTLSAALSALPVTGGTIYLKPGTYTGQNAISYPNVRLRGLGGDPTKVILTAEDGAFSAPFVYPGSGPGNAGASGDQGSSTLDVTKSTYMGTTAGTTTYTPNNFFAEYLTIQNTYNTDATTTSTYSTVSGSCANTGTAQTLQALFNSGLQCNSQALALWIESDQAILNNVNLTSLQDTLYAGSQGCGTFCTVARQYMWKGLITGAVDYVFGDAAMVFDHTNFFTAWHGTSASGTTTIEAQNKKYETGSANDYLSGYICSGCTLMSQSTGMTNLYYGRPYGPYSTWIMLNSFVDQVNQVGWIEFSGDTNLPTSTYAEFNTVPYTDPAVGTPPYPATLFGGEVTPAGGNIGAGVTGTRETTSTDPGTTEAANAIKTQLTAAQAAQYYPVAFLSSPVASTSLSAGQTATWNPVTALAAAVNSFAPTGNVTLPSYGSSVTILGRPQTPGAGIVPTGSYQFMDGSTVLASGSLDASGEAYLITATLAPGTHTISMVYGGDANFTGSTSSTFTVTVPAAPLVSTTTSLTVTNTSSTYGGAISGTVTVTPVSGSVNPTGVVTLLSGSTPLGTCSLAAASGATSSCSYSLTGVAAGAQTMTASYAGNSTFASSASSGVAFSVTRVLLQVTANNATMIVGGTLPSLTYSIGGFVNGDTQANAVTGAPSLTTAATGSSVGEYPIAITTGTLAAANYTFAFTGAYLNVTETAQAPAVATGDSRTVAEPVFPAVCQQLTAAISQVGDDIPTSVDATNTNPDGARIQAALNSCSTNSPGLAVELSIDGAGHTAFLTGPLTMPSNVTLLVDPGVVVFFSRNAQDYDKVPGTHTCGTIDTNSATSSCSPLIDIPGTSTNVGIMGYGKLDGRGGDTLINAITPYGGFSWWGLSAAYTSPNSQQNPRFIQMESKSSNITLYKITLRNAPLFHVSTTGAVNNFTAWDIKIVTPTTSRNTDGIDPGSATNFTITRSWISDGDDNVAVGASGTAPAANISVTHNHFYAGHGESIGSITQAGVSNVLFDGNMSSGNGFAGHGSSVNNAPDSNSTGVRIKSANDRGGLVTGIQYSNSCFLDHNTDIQFTPLYNTNTGTLTPNFKNILMQNLAFVNDASSAGTLQFTGASNGGTINPLQATLDNVTFPSGLSSSSFVTTGTAGTETNAQLTYGPGDVSSNFISAWAGFAGSNGDTVTNNITASSLLPPTCSFTYLAPELTGPSGLPQTIAFGQNAAAVVILTPAVGGAPYPTGTVTLTDALTANSTTVTLTGTTDTISIPLSGLSVGTHSFIATYSGDSNYTLTSGQTVYSTTAPYVIVVNAGSLSGTTTVLSGVPITTPFGTSFTATATVAGSSPTGTVQFIVNGYSYATAAMTSSSTSGTASATIGLPFSASAYSISAVYSGDALNAGSTSTISTVTVTAALTTTALSANTTTTTLGHPVSLTATVSSIAGTPTGTVNFTYSLTSGGTQISLGSSTLSGGTAASSVNLPTGTNYVTATYVAGGSFAGSASAPITVTVNLPAIVPLPNNPIALPYTITTIAGGSGLSIPSSGNMACAGATDKYGDGCQATAIAFTVGDDMRAVVADPFGSVYLSDISATLVRRITPDGTIGNFAGRVTGTACVPTATTGCTPTLVSIGKARGVGTDAAGNIYIANYTGNQVFEVKVSTGLMYLVAGTGTASSTGDGGPATSATVNAPRGAWGDTVGNIYIAESGGNKIRVVDTTGNIHTFAGTGTAGTVGGTDGDSAPATSAAISNPQGVITDVNLNVYISDSSDGRIRVVCVTCGTGSPLDVLLSKLGIASPVNGNIYTIAGSTSTSTYAGTLPARATTVSMAPQKLAMDNSGNLYIADSNGFIWFLDVHTGYIRAVASSAATVCSGATDAVGDGCPATQAKFGSNGGNGFGVGADTLGNVYIADSTNVLIRKVSTNLASPSTATGATFSAPVQLHFIAGDGLAASNGVVNGSSEWSLTAPVCTTNTSSDNTVDCLLTSGFTPAVPGVRSTPLTVNSALGNSSYLSLTGVGLGAGATLDPASQTSFGAGLSVAGLAADNSGDVYVSDAASRNVYRFASSAHGSGATGTSLATLTAPGAVAVDPRGYVYAADTSTGLITQISPLGTVSTLPFAFTTPAGLAVDRLNNLYVSDASAQAVYQINPISSVARTLALGTLVTPKGLAIDPSGNLLVADPGAPAIYRFNFQSGVRTTLSTPAVAPSAVLTDAAGNLLVADTTDILAVPASGSSSPFTVASLTPSALAIDAAGNLYTASGGAVLKLTRTQGSVQFASASAAPQTVSMLASGNQASTLSSISQTDSTDFSISGSASAACSLASPVAAGAVCTLTASFAPQTTGNLTDTATLAGNFSNVKLATPQSLQLTLTGNNVANVSGSVKVVMGGLSYSTVKHVGSETVTITNTSANAIAAPLQLVLSGLPSTVTAVNNTGTYQGNPYWTVSTSSLAPGASVQVTVQFSYTAGTNFVTSSTVYSGVF
jgi:sugar lactone lactonase YvrE